MPEISKSGDPPPMKLTPRQVAYVVLQHWGGFTSGVPRGMADSAIKAVAIALSESGGDAHAHNKNAATRDDSYGLFQINMYGSLGPARRKEHGLSKNEDLFSTDKNVAVAHKIWENAGNDFTDWSVYKNGLYLLNVPAATQAVENPDSNIPGRITPGPGDIDTQVGGKVIDWLKSGLIDPILDFLKMAGLRLAGFIGGAALIIGAIVLVAKRGVK